MERTGFKRWVSSHLRLPGQNPPSAAAATAVAATASSTAPVLQNPSWTSGPDESRHAQQQQQQQQQQQRPGEQQTPGRQEQLGGELSPSRRVSLRRRLSLPDHQLVEIRAAQRTFEGAYIRTALGQFGFALVVLRIFTNEFFSIGALFAAYGACILLIALYRRHQGNSQFFLELEPGAGEVSKFRTSGNVVVVMTALSLSTYVVLLALIVNLDG